MKLKVEVISDNNSNKKVTEAILKLLSKYENFFIKDVQAKE